VFDAFVLDVAVVDVVVFDVVVLVVAAVAVAVVADGADVTSDVVDVTSDVVEAAVLPLFAAPAESANASAPAPATELVAIAAVTAFTRRRPRVRCSEVRFVMRRASSHRVTPGWKPPERSLCLSIRYRTTTTGQCA
jgi:hypothetical protein